MAKKFKEIYQFKIVLDHIKPSIWRRIQVPSNYTFWDLHVALQSVMGWTDSHLHQFDITNPQSGEKVEISIPTDDDQLYDRALLEGWKEKISDYFMTPNTKCVYTYDFGDNWRHTITFEKILPVEQGVEYPRCLDGARACPPDDCGGIPGYENLLEVMKNPKDEEYENMVAWLGGVFDSELFEPNKVIFWDPKEHFECVFEEASD